MTANMKIWRIKYYAF